MTESGSSWLSSWKNGTRTREYDCLGLEEMTYSILNPDVSSIMVPVRPGRNIPIIVETAALNQRLKKQGIFTARELDRSIQESLKKGTVRDHDRT